MIMNIYKDYGKRFFDLTFVLLLSPVLSLIIVLISTIQVYFYGVKIFYLQERHTKNAKVFKLIKFKTMLDTYDQFGNLLPDRYRITKFGEFLRASSLDETPNFVNVLVGHLSIVGPRPLPVKFYGLMSNRQRKRYHVRSGITGLAQINGRNALSWKNKLNIDLAYCKKLKLSIDIKIIVKTIFVLAKNNKNDALFDQGIDNYSPDFKS